MACRSGNKCCEVKAADEDDKVEADVYQILTPVDGEIL